MNAEWTVSSVWVDTTSRHIWTVNICSGTFRMYYRKLMQLVDAQPLCGKHRKSAATTWRVQGSSPPGTLFPPLPSDHCCCGNCVSCNNKLLLAATHMAHPNPQWLGSHSQNLISSVPSKIGRISNVIHRRSRKNPKGNRGFPDLLHIICV